MQVTPSEEGGGRGGPKQMDVLFVDISDISGVCECGDTSPASPVLAINLSGESLLLPPAPPVHLILILRQSFKARLYKYRLVKLITRPSRPATLIRSEQPGFNRKIRAGMCWQ